MCARKELDDDLLLAELARQPTKPGFVLVGRHSDHELLAEFLRKRSLEANGGLVVEPVERLRDVERFAQFIRGEPLHAH